MATAARVSNLKKPWAWLLSLAVLGLILASSTALYVVNPSVRLPLPWWSAVAAPAAVYAIVLPLCVPGLNAGGWVAGFLILAALHLGLGVTTAWLYSVVAFTTVKQALMPAFWGFPPALVLEMVGSLVMALPFLDSLAPRPAARRSRAAPPEAVKARKQVPTAPQRAPADSQARQAWARSGGQPEPLTDAATVVTTTTATIVPVPAVQAVEKEPPAAVVEPSVRAAALSGVNGAPPDTIPEMPPDTFPQRPTDITEDELVATEPSARPTAEALPDFSRAAASESRTPGDTIRIPFDRVMEQLPPAAFRLSLAQVGAQLMQAEALLVPQSLVVAQLGEGVVQVAWEVVAGQFPPEIFAVPPSEIPERIVNGRLLLPLDEIVRQLPPDLFAASMARGPVEMRGIEGFPAPFRPAGWEEGRAAVQISPAAAVTDAPESVSIELPDAQVVARDLGLASLPDVTVAMESDLPPGAELPAVLSLTEKAPPAPRTPTDLLTVEAGPADPVPVVEIDEVPTAIDLDRLFEARDEAQAVPIAPTTRDSEPEPAPSATHESPSIPALPASTEPMIRIPFERVMEQLPPGAFRVPLPQVGAQLPAGLALLVPQSLVLEQLGEGVVQVPWEAVVDQFPPGIFAIPATRMSERIVNGCLILPLDEIVPQLPPEAFAASMSRGAAEVPGIEGFPAPFKPIGYEEPAPLPSVEASRAEVAAPPARDEAPPAPAPPIAAPPPSVPSPALPTLPIAVTRSDVTRLAALLVQWDALAVGEEQVGDFTVITAGAAGLAGGAVAAAAGRLAPLLAAQSPWPVEQATLRAAGASLVLTPVGSGWTTGAAIAVGLRSSGTLARLEMLTRREAAGHAVPAPEAQDGSRDGAGSRRLEPVPTQAAGAEVAAELDAFGPMHTTTFRAADSGASIHCFLPADVAAAPLAAFACALAEAMAAEGPVGGFGPFHSAVLRSGIRRLEVRRLPSATGAATILVVGGADTGRPGLARLQVERAAARLLGT